MLFNHDYCNNFFDHNDPYMGRYRFKAWVDFRTNFRDFLERAFAVPHHTAQTLAETLLARMGDKTLHYHTPVHVLSMLQMAKQIEKEGGFKLDNLQTLAIWFHDAVYDVTAEPGQNEAGSYIFMKALLQQWISYEDRDAVWMAIMATSRHLEIQYDPNVKQHIDWRPVLDLDICNFAWSQEANQESFRCVGLEYTDLYTPEQYNEGRAIFLTKLASREHIFHTDFFREHYEAKARENITKALDLL